MKESKDIKTNIDQSKTYVLNQNIDFIRKTLLVCIFLYSMFGILDAILYIEHIKVFFIIRFAIVVPYLIFLYLISFTEFFNKYNQHLLVLLYFLAGSGIILMTYTIGGDNYYTNGLFLVFAIGFYLIRLRLVNSMISFFSVILFFIILELISPSMSAEEVYVNLFFYVTFAVIGIFGGFFNEKYLKSQYKYENKVTLEKKELKWKINQQLVKINQQLEEINTAQVGMIYAVAQLAESRDKLTADHLERVGNLSYQLAAAIPESIYVYNESNKKVILDSIKLSSILHDIGKIAISDEILNKKGKLTPSEYEIMKTHSDIGSETLKSIGVESLKNDFVVMGIEIAKYHHEKWDGTGYPSGLSGRDIPFSARIVAVIDVYDALISTRPYKEKFSKQKSLSIIKEGSGTHFDPTIAEIFVEIASKSSDETLYWK